ncbi:MAG: ectoine/hydroxyectoine ABC transporter permease subunit EhuD [Rhodospirillales bacterium]|nr:ectoine/hydroxyectoine ABC transporter permease subunit EhuD [Rhodospirillales bacterium]
MKGAFHDLVLWAPDLWTGTKITVSLTFASMAVALVIGLVLALARVSSRRRLLALPATVFVELIRGSPLLLQLFYIFYVFPFFGLRLGKFEAGILGLAINYGAYLSEVFRAGIEAVDKGQWEAAGALGLSRPLALRLVILPQAIRIVIPPIGNYFISLFKDTALVSTISIPELIFTGQLIAADTFKYLQVYSFIFVIYLIISYPASRGVAWFERRLRPARGAAAGARGP